MLMFCLISALSLALTLSPGEEPFPIKSEGDVNFTVDVARFRIGEGTYLELYYEVPSEELTYLKEEVQLKASFQAQLTLKGPRGEEVVEEWDRVSYIPSLEVARRRALSALDQYALYPLRDGEYELSLGVTDINSGEEGEVRAKVKIEPWDDQLTLSDLELAISVEPDTGKGIFTKSGLRIVPNPTHEFGNRRMLLYSYSEIYNLRGRKYEVRYSIHDDKGSLIKSLPPRRYSITGDRAIEVGAVNVMGLPPADYSLKVEVEDTSGLATSSSPFRVMELLLPKQELVMSEGAQNYYRLIEYLATDEELKFYRSLSDTGREQYITGFWRKRDPTPSTPQNEALEEFAERMRYADKEWSTQLGKGRDADRGRIYIRYGRPDETEHHPAELSYKPYESWLYYGEGGRQFIFCDLSGYGDYELIYSSEGSELSDPQWHRYIDPSVIQVKRR